MPKMKRADNLWHKLQSSYGVHGSWLCIHAWQCISHDSTSGVGVVMQLKTLSFVWRIYPLTLVLLDSLNFFVIRKKEVKLELYC